MADYESNDSVPPASDDRSSFIWLWIILALIAIVGAYSTYHSRQSSGTPTTNEAAVNSSGQTTPNIQAPNTEAPNTEAPNTEAPNH